MQIPMLIECLGTWRKRLNKKGREYRWEFMEIGQGHYFKDGWECLLDAEEHSKGRPHLTVLVEQFKPVRIRLVRIKDGEVIEEVKNG